MTSLEAQERVFETFAACSPRIQERIVSHMMNAPIGNMTGEQCEQVSAFTYALRELVKVWAVGALYGAKPSVCKELTEQAREALERANGGETFLDETAFEPDAREAEAMGEYGPSPEDLGL